MPSRPPPGLLGDRPSACGSMGPMSTPGDEDTASLSPSAKTPPRIPLQARLIAGRFTVEALAGRGGMGSVYRAVDHITGKPVALKFSHAITSEALHRFSR